MAHEIEIINGRASFASVRETAWHRLGIILPDYIDKKSMMIEAGLNWEVTLEGVLNEKTGVPINNAFATTRSTDGRTLGIVKGRYTILQNADMFDIGDNILGEEASWETAGSLHNGSSVFALAKLNQELYVGDGEKIDPFFLITNSHDGTKSLQLAITPVRVVCQNTLNMALRGNKRVVNIRHTRNSDQKIEEAKKTLGLVKHYYEDFTKQAEVLLNKSFARSQFEDLIATLLPVSNDASKREKTIQEGEAEKLFACWGSDDIANVRHTAWGAYNAVADYADHFTRVNGDGREAKERRFERSMYESEIKDAALKILLAV